MEKRELAPRKHPSNSCFSEAQTLGPLATASGYEGSSVSERRFPASHSVLAS